jgi:hypothetical protein
MTELTAQGDIVTHFMTELTVQTEVETHYMAELIMHSKHRSTLYVTVNCANIQTWKHIKRQSHY